MTQTNMRSGYATVSSKDLKKQICIFLCTYWCIFDIARAIEVKSFFLISCLKQLQTPVMHHIVVWNAYKKAIFIFQKTYVASSLVLHMPHLYCLNSLLLVNELCKIYWQLAWSLYFCVWYLFSVHKCKDGSIMIVQRGALVWNIGLDLVAIIFAILLFYCDWEVFESVLHWALIMIAFA